MADDSNLVVLVDCRNGIEATSIRLLLESQGIACAVMGEMSALVGLAAAAFSQPRVMVAPADLERARTLLASETALETTGRPLEGGVCAVHEEQAIATCARCGNFLCAKCESAGQPPVCEACLEHEKLPTRSPPSGNQTKIFFVVLAAIVAVILSRSLWHQIH